MALPGPENTAAPTTLRDALVEALGQNTAREASIWLGDDLLRPAGIVDRVVMTHPAMQSWLRANDAALVALAEGYSCTCWAWRDTTKVSGHTEWCAKRVHAAAIAAARERLR